MAHKTIGQNHFCVFILSLHSTFSLDNVFEWGDSRVGMNGIKADAQKRGASPAPLSKNFIASDFENH